MISRRNFFIITVLMSVVFFLCMFINDRKDRLNDYGVNALVTGTAEDYPSQVNIYVPDSLRNDEESGQETAEGVAEEDAAVISRGRVICIGGAEGILQDVVKQWAVYTKRDVAGYDSLALYDEAEKDAVRPEMLVIDAGHIDWNQNDETKYLMDQVSHGTHVVFAAYQAGAAKGYQVIDVMPEAKIPGAVWVNLSKVNGPLEGFEKDAKLLLVCAKGKRGYFLQNRLKAFGYTNTKVLEGGITFNEVKVEGAKSTISAEDVKRVKALGCLQDKNHPDHFNVRVITRNGKITAKEQQCIAEAAERYGSGEVTMTTRLTLEIQGVPYDKIEEVREYLMREGLETGGTGSKVRPVVSCKGTTCQYGLIDTFALSEEIHERFYKGFNDVKLPHKFKIAVGGCPNNCVKPDLNDLGVIGQRVPLVDESLCHGCKICQVENNCPLKDAKVEEINGERKLKIDKAVCNHCGRCIGKCPFGAVKEADTGYRVYIGGRWGKKIAHGKALNKVFTDKEEVLQVIEKAILFFRDEGITGERFADTIDRLGFDYVQDKLMSDELLARKEEVIKAQKHLVGGATC